MPSRKHNKKETEEDSSSSDNSSVLEEDDDEEDHVSRASKKARTDHQTLLASPLEVVPAALTNNNNNLQRNQPPVIVLLDQATLETVKNKRGQYELLNCDDHRELCKRKLRKDPSTYRPDILHQELLAAQDSPLNKAGLLKVYISTQRNVLIDLHPACRIPRTYKRFSGLMVQLLHKMKIKAAAAGAGGGGAAGWSNTTLLKVIKNPFSQYLPAGTTAYGMSCQGTLYSPLALARAVMPQQQREGPGAAPVCFIVGAMSTGHVQVQDHPYIQKMISVSEYPLSGAAALSRIMAGIEHHWGIV